MRDDVPIRIARQQDIPDISRVLARSWRHAYRGIIAGEFLDKLEDDRWELFLESGMADGSLLTLVAYNGEQAVGAAIMRTRNTDLSGTDTGKLPDGTGELTALYLLPEHIGTGVGQALYDMCEAILRQQGVRRIVLDVLRGNDRALWFYEKNGFAAAGKDVPTELDGREYMCRVMVKELR